MHLAILLLTSLLAADRLPPAHPRVTAAAAAPSPRPAPAAAADEESPPAKAPPPPPAAAPGTVDIARLRAEYDKLRDALFRSRARAELVEEGVYASKMGARIRWKG